MHFYIRFRRFQIVRALQLLFSLALALIPLPIWAHQHTVRTTDELTQLLAQNKEQGEIILDGDIFNLNEVDVKAGGYIRPAKGRNPVFLGRSRHFSKGRNKTERDFWTVKMDGFQRGDFYVFDSKLNEIPISDQVCGERNIEMVEKEIETIDDTNLTIRFKIPAKYSELKNKQTSFFKNCTLKLTCWYVCMNVSELYSDGTYLYGNVNGKANYSKLGIHPDMSVYATFFNYPSSDISMYVDGQGFVHVPNQYDEIYLCQSTNILNLQGGKSLIIEGVRFLGSDKPIMLGNNSLNKTISNCTFETCGMGIDYQNFVNDAVGNFVVKGCTFMNLYSNDGIYVLPVKNIYIGNNRFCHIGLYNKGGAAITVNGEDFFVENNEIRDFSYHGISCGMDEKYSFKVIRGEIKNNIVDNEARYGDASRQLYDGGGIYVYTHVNSLLIDGNVIRNSGFKDGLRFGLYLDGGAYNVTAKNNLIYNMYPGQPAIHARYIVNDAPMYARNYFISNIVIGDCVFGGNNSGAVPELEGNYVSGEIKQWKNNPVIGLDNNLRVKASVEGGTVYIDRGVKLKKRHYSTHIKSVVNTRRRLDEYENPISFHE